MEPQRFRYLAALLPTATRRRLTRDLLDRESGREGPDPSASSKGLSPLRRLGCRAHAQNERGHSKTPFEPGEPGARKEEGHGNLGS